MKKRKLDKKKTYTWATLLLLVLIAEAASRRSQVEQARARRRRQAKESEKINSMKYVLDRVRREDDLPENKTLLAFEKMKKDLSKKTHTQKLEILTDEEEKLLKLEKEKKRLERARRKKKKKKKHIRLQHIKDELEETLDGLLDKNKKPSLKNKPIIGDEAHASKTKGLKNVVIDYTKLYEKVQQKVVAEKDNLFWNFHRLEQNRIEELLLENYNFDEEIVLNPDVEDREFKKLSEIRKTVMTDFLEANVKMKNHGFWKERGKVFVKSSRLKEFENYRVASKLDNAGKNETLAGNTMEDEGDEKPTSGLQGLDSLDNAEFDWDTSGLNSDFDSFEGR